MILTEQDKDWVLYALTINETDDLILDTIESIDLDALKVDNELEFLYGNIMGVLLQWFIVYFQGVYGIAQRDEWGEEIQKVLEPQGPEIRLRIKKILEARQSQT
jgi:hypothetical protein